MHCRAFLCTVVHALHCSCCEAGIFKYLVFQVSRYHWLAAPHLTSHFTSHNTSTNTSSHTPHNLLLSSSQPPYTILTHSSHTPHTLLTPSSNTPHTLLTTSSHPSQTLLTNSSQTAHTLLKEAIKKCLSFGHCPKGGGVQPESKSFEVVLFSPSWTFFWTLNGEGGMTGFQKF